ncbi:alpha/beta hydrolase [Flexithrix dorotheae]|uniref:alpha/beta hydrolase n=1 Tax=Flexithrix dorotheae TaxID=70993 RepID=UPI00037A995A|nr:alpha/beta hydrolase [Flexithrix dorotheae]
MLKVLKWFFGGIGGIMVILVLVYYFGPKIKVKNMNGTLPVVNNNLIELEKEIEKSEAAIIGLKENNEARIIWADEQKKEKTPYSIVYLHGFSASQGEGEPVHMEVAKYYGCNLYLSRLEGHGIQEEEVFFNLKPESFLASAKKAVAIGKEIGEKVIVMGTSTGGMFGLYLAAENPEIAGLVLYSPLVDFYDPNAKLLAAQWGLQVGRVVMGSDYAGFTPKYEIQENYWSTKYRIEGLVTLSALVTQLMKPEVFAKIKCPLFLGYYYKNEKLQDQVVSVGAMREMFGMLGTPDSLKVNMPFPEAGEHVIASKYVSKNWQEVRDSTMVFLGETMNLQPVDELPYDVK